MRDAYNKTFSRDLHHDIKDKTSGDFEKAIIALATDVNEYDAKNLRAAFGGLGSNKDLITEILCTRSDAELKAISHAYNRMYQEELKARVHSESKGNLRAVYETVLGGRSSQGDVKDAVAALYAAGAGKIGTDEKVFVEILAGNNRKRVAQIATAYEQTHGKSLFATIKSEFSGNLKTALQTLVRPTAEFYAEVAVDCFARMNVDEAGVIRVIRSRKEKDLVQVSVEMAKLKKHQELSVWVVKKTSGNLQKILTAVTANFAGRAAIA